MSEPRDGSAFAGGVPALEPQPLSEVARVVDTFVAPSRTFADILRNASWWLPFLLMLVFSTATSMVVSRKVGFDQVALNNLHQAPAQEDRINALPPDQKAHALELQANIAKYIAYAFPVLIVIINALYALILWGSFNFGLGARTTYPQVFATCFFAGLPYLVTYALTIVTLLFGGSPENYDYKNPVGTNPAYYMHDAAPWLKALLGRFDVVQLWVLALTILGMAIISKKKIGASAAIVGGFWLLATLLAVGAAAATS